jgi:hypothetical protein
VDPSECRGLFRGSELPRLLALAAIMVVGWGLVWQSLHQKPEPVEPPVRVEPKHEPVVPDSAPEFESVTDRTAMGFRDNAAYSYLLQKARKLTLPELARQSRRDIMLTHFWDRPELYRGVPIHLAGTIKRLIRYEAKMSKTGWIYEASIFTREAGTYPYQCVFEDLAIGLPLGVELSEKVGFDGFFLKIMKYQAGDIVRGAPVLVGKLDWKPLSEGGPAAPAGWQNGGLLYWSLIAVGAMFFISLGRWLFQLYQTFSRPHAQAVPTEHPADTIEREDLAAWLRAMQEDAADSVDEPH